MNMKKLKFVKKSFKRETFREEFEQPFNPRKHRAFKA